MEQGTIEIPEFSAKRHVVDGIINYPAAIELTYKLGLDGTAINFFQNWFTNQGSTKDMTIIRTNAEGTEFSRRLLTDVACAKVTDPAFDAGATVYGQIVVTIVPFDVQFVPPEN